MKSHSSNGAGAGDNKPERKNKNKKQACAHKLRRGLICFHATCNYNDRRATGIAERVGESTNVRIISSSQTVQSLTEKHVRADTTKLYVKSVRAAMFNLLPDSLTEGSAKINEREGESACCLHHRLLLSAR